MLIIVEYVIICNGNNYTKIGEENVYGQNKV